MGKQKGYGRQRWLRSGTKTKLNKMNAQRATIIFWGIRLQHGKNYARETRNHATEDAMEEKVTRGGELMKREVKQEGAKNKGGRWARKVSYNRKGT